jgi:hypothetical protein
MKPGLTLMAMLMIAGAAARAQQNPVAASPVDSVGPADLAVGGTLHYDLRYAETARWGDSQGSQQQSYASGDASYTGQSQLLPFSLQYGGGYGWVWSGQSEPGNFFQHLLLSQGIVRRSWKLAFSDDVNYTFETPTTGFSGVPGTGEPIGGSGPTTPPNLTILTVNTRTLNNLTTASAARRLDYATTLNLGGTAGELLYVDNNGQDVDTLAAEAGVSRRLSARNSLSGEYSFSRFNYGKAAASQTGFAQISYGQTNSLQIRFSRQWTRKISYAGSIGPQWISSSNSAIMPSSTRFTASASVQETFKSGGAGLLYNHGVTGGSGYMLGAESDTVGANYSRGIGRKLTVGATGSYLRTTGLNNNGAIRGEYGGVQATRSLGRYFNVFANYTATNQSSSLLNAPNVLNSLTQVIGFGIGYSPREKHFKR